MTTPPQKNDGSIPISTEIQQEHTEEKALVDLSKDNYPNLDGDEKTTALAELIARSDQSVSWDSWSKGGDQEFLNALMWNKYHETVAIFRKYGLRIVAQIWAHNGDEVYTVSKSNEPSSEESYGAYYNRTNH